MKKKIIKIAAYLVLIFGLLLSLALLLPAGFLFLSFPEGNFQKKMLLAFGFVIAAGLALIGTLVFFEALSKVEELNEEVWKLEAEVEQLEKIKPKRGE